MTVTETTDTTSTFTYVEPVKDGDGIRLVPEEDGRMCIIRRPEGTFLVTRAEAEADA